jgi:TRAP-type uncharacterized transport system fused permease subunit
MTVSFLQILIFFVFMFMLFGDFKKILKALALAKIYTKTFFKKLGETSNKHEKK